MINWAKTNTIETLKYDGSSACGAVLEYGDKVFVCGTSWEGGYEAAIYEHINDEFEDILTPVERTLVLVKVSPMSFEDSGSAIKWCFDNVKTTKHRKVVAKCKA